jgi:hypothetical protein
MKDGEHDRDHDENLRDKLVSAFPVKVLYSMYLEIIYYNVNVSIGTIKITRVRTSQPIHMQGVVRGLTTIQR